MFFINSYIYLINIKICILIMNNYFKYFKFIIIFFIFILNKYLLNEKIVENKIFQYIKQNKINNITKYNLKTIIMKRKFQK